MMILSSLCFGKLILVDATSSILVPHHLPFTRLMEIHENEEIDN